MAASIYITLEAINNITMNKIMLVSIRNILLPVIACFFAITSFAFEGTPIEGRWDINIDMNGKKAPAWLEVKHSGFKTLVGQVVVVVGSARPISKINFADNKFDFSVPPQWEQGAGDMSFNGVYENDQVKGTVTYPDGKSYSFTGIRAPLLDRENEPVWGAPIKLFNGKDLTGWHALGATNQWVAENGVLKSPKSGSNLATDATFKDFKLHLEFRYPKESNSGVYLRGRYEVQITDSKGLQPDFGLLGGVYGFIIPSSMEAKDAGEWQSYDITLVGRMITLEVNGKKVICNQAIPGITGGALDSNEGEVGPIYFQGDHGPIEFRNIVITPAK